MPFRIVIEINGDDMKAEDVRSTASYICETLRVMGHSYSMNCHLDNMELMMRENP